MFELERYIRNSVDKKSKYGIEEIGNTLWRGPALEVVSPITIKPERSAKVSFSIASSHLPFDGHIQEIVLQQLLLHIRSRYAHLGLDLNMSFYEALMRKEGIPKEGKEAIMSIELINFGLRPIEITKGAKVFHPFIVPEKAYIKSGELERIVGNHERKSVYIQGKNEEDWRMVYECNAEGLDEAVGIMLKIDKKERFRIPSSPDPIKMIENGTFADFREWFNENKETIDPNISLPDNAFWVGAGPHIALAPDIYMQLGLDTYQEIDREFIKCGSQISSPLLEGLRTNHRPHFEIVGQGEWIRASIVRNGKIATAD